MILNEILFKKLTKDNKSEIIQYATQQWHKWNKKFFKNKLPFGSIYVQKDTGPDVRRLGVYSGKFNRIGLNRRLVLAGEEKFNEVLLHEMCHQATIQIDKVYKDHHGPTWASWMRKCKLPPNRLSTSPTNAYLTQSEIDAKQRKIKQREKLLATVKAKQLQPYQLANMLPASYTDVKTNSIINGLIVCKHDQAGSRWAFMTGAYSDSWKIIPNTWFFELSPIESKQYLKSDWIEAAQRIIKHYESKREQRSTRSQYKKLSRSLYGF